MHVHSCGRKHQGKMSKQVCFTLNWGRKNIYFVRAVCAKMSITPKHHTKHKKDFYKQSTMWEDFKRPKLEAVKILLKLEKKEFSWNQLDTIRNKYILP